MLKRYHRFVSSTFRLVDVIVIGTAWLLSYLFRFSFPIIPVTKGFPAFSTYASLLPLVMGLWSMTLSSMKAYRSTRMLRRTHEVHLLLKAHLISMLLFIALTYLFSEYKYSRGVMLYFGVLGGLGLIVFRLTLRNLLRSIRKKGRNLRYTLLIGSGSALKTVAARFQKFPEMGYRIKGILTNTTEETNFEIPILGSFHDLEKILSEHSIDQLIIGLRKDEQQHLEPILKQIQDETVEIRLIPDVHEYVTIGCEVEDFEGFPIVNLNDSPLEGWGTIFKRLTDIFVSAITLLILFPLFLVIGILIKIFSPGPIFYRQIRMGLDGKNFGMLKFRSMRVDAEAQSGAVWAVKNDPRRTKLGEFLRKTSLDELPQFWNVLKGEMSLVGPRPERPVFVEQFKKEIPHYMLRHKVKAGITGWAQVNGWRGNTSLERRIECDLYYIRNWSYLLDWRILFLTLWKGFINKNAY
ncbi:MAG: undecaprenyl-phosphate glucose phosphotransferase [Bdellovibrionaceae bacterium]|nr:undecaprenyl-phosphate glucose phosphotransferase [Pseudobdellovibrionaceae bacterium]